jgi:hypothetical protein
MGTVIGAVEMTLGSEDPIELQLLQDDGVNPIGSLTGITELTLVLIDEDGTETGITTNFAVSDAALSKVKLSQTAAQFPEAQRYDYKVKFKTSGGKQRFVPDGSKWYQWQVFPVSP